MKDIPCFATEYGVASLALQQIPYTGIAYITIQSTQTLDIFLLECVGFCRAAGATRVLASGHTDLNRYPVFTRVLRMQAEVPTVPDNAYLFPVTEQTLGNWLEIYNDGMKNVPNALILSRQMAEEIVEKGTAYFVHTNGALLGIGIVENDTVQAVVSRVKGAGEQIMTALMGAVCGDQAYVEVAENNLPAVRLYQRMGFVQTQILKEWYIVGK